MEWTSLPLCGAGMLCDGLKIITQEYKGHVFTSQTHGSFCDHCAEGFVEFDAVKESAWMAFHNQVDAAEWHGLGPLRAMIRP